MLIGIEATRANRPGKTGVEWYAWHMIQELKRITANDANSWLLYANAPLQGGLEMMPPNWQEVRATWRLPFGWTQCRLSWELWRRSPNVAFFPGSTLPRITPRQTVVTIHDVGFHHFPQLYKRRQVRIHEVAVRETRRRAAWILTVSEASKRDLVDVYHFDPARITVTPLGIDHGVYRVIVDRSLVADVLRRYHITSPYFITIGRLEAKKNILTLINAFTEFKRQRGADDPHQLVLIGQPGYGIDDIRRAIASSAARNDIHELGYVPEADIPALLNAAQALIHPSWFEGFGLPPLQAMACGCPVIASTAGSLPEIVGDAGLLVPPGQTAEFVAAMETVAMDDERAAQLRSTGLLRAAAYTWDATARQTLPLLTNWD